MDHKQLIQTIKISLERIENPQYEQDYDQVAIVLSMAKDIISLIQIMFDEEKIRLWKMDEESTFDRFSAYLHKFLQSQTVYLNTINPELIVKSNILQLKLQNVQDQIARVRNQSLSILTEGTPLFAQMDTLHAQKQELNDLRQRKSQIEAVAAELSGIDMDKLRAEILEQEAVNQRLKLEYQPLLERKTFLEAEAFQVRDATRNVTELISGLENAKTEEMARHMENLTSWFARLRSIQTNFQVRVQKLEADLQIEAENLRNVVSQFQEKIQRIEEFSDKAYACQEELRAHFSVNQQIENDTEFSLVSRQEQIERLSREIKSQLGQYDQALSAMLKQIDAADAKIKPLSF
jgi:hypothetical protein